MVSKLVLFLCMFLRLGFAVGQVDCGASQAKLTVAILYDANPGETTVELTDTTTADGASEIVISKIANDVVMVEQCVQVATLYKIAIKDSGNDGVIGPGYVSFSVNDRLIAALSDFGSEAVYYFSAAAQDCSDSRFIMDIKYDSNPGAVSATMTNAANAVVFSLAAGGLNSASLAGQFVHIGRGLAISSYSFSITAANGISSPGFYRIFSENTLLARDGGDNGFKGTASTSFAVVDNGPQPTPAPAPKTCDDAFEEKYIDPDGATQNCIYLASRPQLIDSHCAESLDVTSAYQLCPETCGVCADMCEDNEGAKFEVDGAKGRTCEYVRVRLSFNYDQFFPIFCQVNTTSYIECPESCGSCDMIITDPENTDDPPEDDSGRDDPCVDSATTKIWVDNNTGEESCGWLVTNDEYQAEYCMKNHLSNAYNVCAGTCKKCDN